MKSVFKSNPHVSNDLSFAKEEQKKIVNKQKFPVLDSTMENSIAKSSQNL